jgi:hypothetical protein
VVRRNQSHLTPRPSIINTDETPQPTPEPSQDRVSTRSQTGVQIGPPSRLTYWRKGDVVSD